MAGDGVAVGRGEAGALSDSVGGGRITVGEGVEVAVGVDVEVGRAVDVGEGVGLAVGDDVGEGDVVSMGVLVGCLFSDMTAAAFTAAVFVGGMGSDVGELTTVI